jgi:predicted DsbA family dithiol-disulfide isomerase
LDVTFHFDPVCPWSWRTSRWLHQVAEERALTIEWRSFSIALQKDGDVSPDHRAPLEAAKKAMRLVEALAADGRHTDAGRFYTELGTRTHSARAILDEDAVRAAAAAAGLEKKASALDEDRWDEAVRASHEAAYTAAGPDIGSPVIVLPGAQRGLFGPVLAGVPGPRQSAELWDAVETMLKSNAFLELKRGRR